MLDQILTIVVAFFLYLIIAIIIFGVIVRLMRDYFNQHQSGDMPPGLAWPVLGGVFWPTFPLWLPFYILGHFARFAFRAGVGEVDWYRATRKLKGKYWTLRARAAKE